MIRASHLSKSEAVALNKRVFTKTAAARILGKRDNKDYTAQVKKIKVDTSFEYVVWVWIPGLRPCFISRLDFIVEFIDFRNESAMSGSLNVISSDSHLHQAWVESSSDKGTSVYTLSLKHDSVSCDCHDFEHQSGDLLDGINRYIAWEPTCKHVYAFLFSHNIYSQSGWRKNNAVLLDRGGVSA